MSFFHYATYKYVTIRDPRLGVGYYVTALVIVTFTLAEIFLSKGYLEYDTHPIGTLRLLLSDPDDEFVHQEPPPECCVNRNQKLSLSIFSFKFEPFVILASNGECLSQCRYLDAQELSWPIQSRTLSVMTFCKERWQSNRQSTEHPEEFKTLREERFFTLKPEEYVVKIEHSVIATKFFGNTRNCMVAGSQRNMEGWLWNVNGTKVREMKKGADKLTIRELFSAAGVNSLDDISDALNAKGKKFRRHGLVLHVTIKYTNVDGTWLGTGPIQYGYHVSRIPYADYRVNELTPIFNGPDLEQYATPRSRVLRKRYGIKMEFHQAGMLGQFSLASLFLKLASGMGLLTLTATIVDSLALYVLPDRFRYRSFVYETSPVVEKDVKLD